MIIAYNKHIEKTLVMADFGKRLWTKDGKKEIGFFISIEGNKTKEEVENLYIEKDRTFKL